MKVSAKNRVSSGYSRFEATEPSPYPGAASTGFYPPVTKPDDAGNSETLVARLNDRFRVIVEGGADPRQWLLQRSKSVKGRELWDSISFCVTRDGLLLMIRDKCIPLEEFKRRYDYPVLDAKAIATIKALPNRFPRRT